MFTRVMLQKEKSKEINFRILFKITINEDLP